MGPKAIAWTITGSILAALGFLAYKDRFTVGDQVEVKADNVLASTVPVTSIDPGLAGQILIIEVHAISGNTVTGVAIGVVGAQASIDVENISLSFAKGSVLGKHTPPIPLST